MRTATMLLALGVVLVAAPAWADFEAGVEAHERGDYATALKEFRALAEQGGAEAQNNLGWMYERGQGVPQDYAEAIRWFRLAVEQGNARAQTALGWMYDQGRGVPQDDNEAIRWYRLAVEQGNAGGQYNLGLMYANGRGVPQDDVHWPAMALFWLALIGTYSAANIGASFLTAARRGWDLLPVLPLVFACFHLAYGYGFLRGILDFLIFHRAPSSTYIRPSRPSVGYTSQKAAPESRSAVGQTKGGTIDG